MEKSVSQDTDIIQGEVRGFQVNCLQVLELCNFSEEPGSIRLQKVINADLLQAAQLRG